MLFHYVWLYNKLNYLFEREEKMKPKLRFKEFDEDWEEKKLGEMFDNISDKKHPELPVLSVTQDKGTIYRDNLEIDIKFDKQSLSTYKKVLPGQFIISLRSFQGGLELSELEGIVSPAYTILNSNTIVDKYFWKFYFKTYNFIQLLKRTTSGIRDGKQISYTDFKTIKSSFPSLPEQEKIGQFFSLLDDRIEKQEQKINLLKERKKGWMQKLFNQEIRFKDENGNDYPDWIKNEVKNIVKSIPAKDYIAQERVEIGFPVYQQGDYPLNGYSNEMPFSDYQSVILFGDHTLSLFKPKKPFLIATDGIKILNFNGFDSYFAYFMLEYYMPLSQGYKRHFSILKEVTVSFPSLPEQEKIANFLSVQDELIEKEEEKLNLLKEQKKGLLQQMFV